MEKSDVLFHFIFLLVMLSSVTTSAVIVLRIAKPSLVTVCFGFLLHTAEKGTPNKGA